MMSDTVVPANPGFFVITTSFHIDEDGEATHNTYRAPVVAWCVSSRGGGMVSPICIPPEITKDRDYAILSPDGKEERIWHARYGAFASVVAYCEARAEDDKASWDAQREREADAEAVRAARREAR